MLLLILAQTSDRVDSSVQRWSSHIAIAVVLFALVCWIIGFAMWRRAYHTTGWPEWPLQGRYVVGSFFISLAIRFTDLSFIQYLDRDYPIHHDDSTIIVLVEWLNCSFWGIWLLQRWFRGRLVTDPEKVSRVDDTVVLE
jgi:hypothetical protein